MTRELPACYAIVQPGLESVAAEEITLDFGGEVRKSYPGIVVFRVPEIDRHLLDLKTTEDVFVLAWGTDQLSYRAKDLDSIQKWTARDADWNKLLQIHHAIRPKPAGKPSLHFVVQMTGVHGYRRVDASKALQRGLGGKLPASWKIVDENASIEIWLTIHGAVAVCGIRLSDATMRHRPYKVEHLPASLRPTVAASMVRLADLKPHQTVIDPMCGAGTLLTEAYLWAKSRGYRLHLQGGDIDPHHVRAAQANCKRFPGISLETWDATRLPLEEQSVDRLLCNPPFGKQLSSPEEIGPLYRKFCKEINRVLKPGGRVVLLVSDVPKLQEAVKGFPWKQEKPLFVRVLGQKAAILVFRKAASGVA